MEIHQTTKIYAASNGAVSKRETRNVAIKLLKEPLELDAEVVPLESLINSFCSVLELELRDEYSDGDTEGALLEVSFSSIVELKLGDKDSGCVIEGVLLGTLRKSFCSVVGLELTDVDGGVGGNTRRLY